MKCPVCWAEKAYRNKVKGTKASLLACLGLVPMKCHHCYHKFVVFWLVTLGKKIEPPMLRIAPMVANRPSHAVLHMASQRNKQAAAAPQPATRRAA
jgi:hypothetical protein